MKLQVNEVAAVKASRRIVNEISRHAQQGEIIGLIGPQGSGKSALLRSVYQLLHPLARYIELGRNHMGKLNPCPPACHADKVGQKTHRDFAFSVREVVAMGRSSYAGSLEARSIYDAAMVQGALQRVKLLDFAEQSFHTLSDGEQQRLWLAQALVQEPKLLLLDEPPNHLDSHYQREILTLVRGLGITIVVTLHDLNLAATYCTRLYFLAAGRIVAAGAPEKVLTPALVRAVYGVSKNSCH